MEVRYWVIHAELPNHPDDPAHVYLIKAVKAKDAHDEAARQLRKEERLPSNIAVHTRTLMDDHTEVMCVLFMQKLSEVAGGGTA